MKLLADSGSTKTDWALIDKSSNDVIRFSTDGMNPYSGFDSKSIKDGIVTILDEKYISNITELHFYGSGCTNATSVAQVRDNLEDWFPHSAHHIYEDLLGAAIAMSGNQPCHIGILGTGSIAAHFDGNQLTNKSKSMGYLISNEGSGSDIGKEMIKSLVNNRLPNHIVDAYQNYPTTRDNLLQSLYDKDNPSQLIASYCTPLVAFTDEPTIRSIVADSFTDYIKWHLEAIIDDPSMPVHFCGSIAYYFRDILAEALEKHHLKMGEIAQKPLPKLIEYHQSN